MQPMNGFSWRPVFALSLGLGIAGFLLAQAGALTPQSTAIPDWAFPGSANHKQVAPPADFHRPSKTTNTPVGIFDGQTDVGSAIIPGSASYNSATKQYTLNSAG